MGTPTGRKGGREEGREGGRDCQRAIKGQLVNVQEWMLFDFYRDIHKDIQTRRGSYPIRPACMPLAAAASPVMPYPTPPTIPNSLSRANLPDPKMLSKTQTVQ